jgi:hypothetical protein
MADRATETDIRTGVSFPELGSLIVVYTAHGSAYSHASAETFIMHAPVH